MPTQDWTVFAEFELYEQEFPRFQHENVQHTYLIRDQFEDKEGLLVMNPFFIRFIEYAFSGLINKTRDGYAGKLLEMPMENVDDLRCGVKGKEINSFYLFPRPITQYNKNLVYVRSAQHHGMRFHFKSQSELQSAISSYKTSRDSLKKLLSKMDSKLLGKQCPFCSSPHLKPYLKETVKCESCGRLHSPEKLRSTIDQYR
jgi:hypothetical protein